MAPDDEYRGTPDGFTEPSHPGWWAPADVPDGFLDMIDALRVLQDRVTAAAPPAYLVAEVTKTVTELSARLAEHAVDERHQVTGHLPDVPGRGQTLTPVLVLDEHDDQRATGRVTFGRYYLGGNGAVHGGALPLLFDDLMGRLANTGDRGPSRTAFLNLDYRSITPIEEELRVTAWFAAEQGRKRFLRGTLHHGDRLCAEAHGLFVELRAGQP
jgi:acyl-coenzyme A thioesterase PaaI-like protein